MDLSAINVAARTTGLRCVAHEDPLEGLHTSRVNNDQGGLLWDLGSGKGKVASRAEHVVEMAWKEHHRSEKE